MLDFKSILYLSTQETGGLFFNVGKLINFEKAKGSNFFKLFKILDGLLQLVIQFYILLVMVKAQYVIS